jgi:hypothetical protein
LFRFTGNVGFVFKLFGVRREAKRHAAFTSLASVSKRCRRCALPPQSKILAAFRALIRQSGLLRVGHPRSVPFAR